MRTLYDIDADITGCVDEETGEVDDENLSALMMERDKKIESVALWIMDLRGDTQKLSEEIFRLTKRKQRTEKQIEDLKEWLRGALGGSKFKNEKIAVTYRESERVIIDDVEQLPSEFVKIVAEKRADKAALKKAFREWDDIAGAHVEKHQNVVVY